MVQVDEFTYRLLEILRNSPLPLYEYLLAFLSKKCIAVRDLPSRKTTRGLRAKIRKETLPSWVQLLVAGQSLG